MYFQHHARHSGFGPVAGLLSLAVLAALPIAAQAQDNDTGDNLYRGKTLTGDWGGWRTRLHEQGIDIHGGIIDEGFDVNHGGIQHGVRNASQTQIGVDFDLGKLTSVWGDARLHVTIDDRHGSDASSDLVGNSYLPLQWSYGSPRTHWAELSYDQNLFRGRLNWRAGFYSIGNYFATPGPAAYFVNGGLTGHPLTLSTNSGWGNFPNSRWTTHLTWLMTPDLTLRGGMVLDNSRYSQKQYSWRLHAPGTSGHTYPLELEWAPGSSVSRTAGWNPTRGAAPGPYVGDYKIGLYYDTADQTMLGDRSDRLASHREGAYAMASQKFTNNAVGGGLTGFASYTRQSQSTSAIHTWSAAGLVYSGMFARRPHDAVGLAYVRVSLNQHLVQQQLQEQALGLIDDPDWQLDQAQELWEASYSFQLTPWLVIRPDVQYLVNPGTFAYTNIDNALAIGAQLRVKF